MGQLTCKAISREELTPGDHICTTRWNGVYYHHGIYVGDGMVIHVAGPKKEGRSAMSFRSSSSTSKSPSWCINCGSKKGFEGGTVKTCLDCFLDGQTLYVYDYECDVIRKHVPKHNGRVKSPSEVVETAYRELEKDPDDYTVFGKNCEHFATYCKTGLCFSFQVKFWGRMVGILFI